MNTSFWKKLEELESSQKDYVLITMVSVRGSAPQDPGAKAIVTKDGLAAGTVGGGKVEAAAIEKAKEIIASGVQCDPIEVTWNLQKDIKMTCGGEVRFLFEHFSPANWQIAIFGAGHVSQELCRSLSRLNCSVTCIDPREEWLGRIQFDNVKNILNAHPEHEVQKFSAKTYFLSITKGHSHDVPVLEQIAKHYPNAPFVGVIGSATKATAIRNELKERNVSDDFLERLIIPIGLPLGSNDPAEIAISISAQLLQKRDQ